MAVGLGTVLVRAGYVLHVFNNKDFEDSLVQHYTFNKARMDLEQLLDQLQRQQAQHTKSLRMIQAEHEQWRCEQKEIAVSAPAAAAPAAAAPAADARR